MPRRNEFSPVVLFVYSRLDHTKLTIQALAENFLAKDTELVIYSDGAKTPDLVEAVQDVRNFLDGVRGFKTIKIIKNESNYGLAENIISGVSEVISVYGRAIVLEDDIVTSPYFLMYMNDALDFYHNKKKVWHISGWSYPLGDSGLEGSFLWRGMNCWGWATWEDRWKSFEKHPKKLMNTWGKENIERFNLDGYHDFWFQVKANDSGILNSWAIFWYAAIFAKDGLSLNPAKSLVKNIGIDGSGENCGRNDLYSSEEFSGEIRFFPEDLQENRFALNRIQNFYKSISPNIVMRFWGKLKWKIKSLTP